MPAWWLTPRSTSAESAICGTAFGDTKAPTSTVCSPAPISASMNAMRSATLIGRLLVLQPVARADLDDADAIAHAASAGRLDFGEFDAFADDIADLAFDLLQHARERRAQGLLHLHRLRASGSPRPSPALRPPRPAAPPRCPATAPRSCPRRPAPRSRRRTDRPNAGRSGRCGCASRAHGPRSTATTRDSMPSSVRSKPPSIGRARREGEFALADRQRRRAVAIAQRHLVLGALPLPERKNAAAAGRPASSQTVCHGECASCAPALCSSSSDGGHGRAKFEIAGARPASGVRFFSSRSMKPVSMVLARTFGCVTSADRNGMLVTMPRTSVSSSAAVEPLDRGLAGRRPRDHLGRASAS